MDDKPTKRCCKKRPGEGQIEDHNPGTSKRKRKKVSKIKIKLSKYEKAVRRFNINQQLCPQSKVENRWITRAPLKVKPARDGLFLKARRSFFVRKEVLNEARKDEDINRIIDIGEGIYDREDNDKREGKGNIFKHLNITETCETGGEEVEIRGESPLTESGILCSGNHEEGTEMEGLCRGNRFGSRFSDGSILYTSSPGGMGTKTDVGISKMDLFDTSGSHHLGNCNRNSCRRNERSTPWFDTGSGDNFSRKAAESGSGIYDELIRAGECSNGSATYPSTSTGKRIVNLQDFEEFTMKFESALASVECPKKDGSGAGETLLKKLKMLYQKRKAIYEGENMSEEAHERRGHGVKPEERLIWFFDGTCRIGRDDSQEAPESGDESRPLTGNFTYEASGGTNIFRGFDGLIRPIDLFRDDKETRASGPSEPLNFEMRII